MGNMSPKGIYQGNSMQRGHYRSCLDMQLVCVPLVRVELIFHGILEYAVMPLQDRAGSFTPSRRI